MIRITRMKMSREPRRNMYDIINDILICCSNSWVSRTNIYQYCRLANKNRGDIIKLRDVGLLVERKHPSHKTGLQYQTTSKGIKFCLKYSKMIEDLEGVLIE